MRCLIIVRVLGIHCCTGVQGFDVWPSDEKEIDIINLSVVQYMLF